MENDTPHSKFSLSSATLYGINVVIGSGIFLLPQKIYTDLGPASLLSFVVDVFLVAAFAFCFAEASGYFDKNGGAFQYANAAFGRLVGFNVGILGWVMTTISWATMSAGFSKLFVLLFPIASGFETAISLTLIILLSLINSMGIQASKIFTIIITTSKLIPIIAFAFSALFFIKSGWQMGNFSPFIQIDPEKTLSSSIASSSLTIFYVFTGFEALPAIAAEVRHPKKNVPRAILSSLSIISILYFMILLGTIALLGDKIESSQAPVQSAFAQMIGPLGKYLISIGAVISIAGINLGDSMMIPRYASSIAQAGLLPACISKTNKQNSPILAIAISAFVTCCIVLTGTFEQLAELSVVMRFIQYIPTALAVIVFRKRWGNLRSASSIRLPGGPIIPIFCMLLSFWMISEAQLKNILFALVSIVLTTSAYFIVHLSRKKVLAGSKKFK